MFAIIIANECALHGSKCSLNHTDKRKQFRFKTFGNKI